jgi:hypothetical protein
MMITTACRALLTGLLACVATAATAQKIPQGTYSMPDSGYSIVVQPQGNDLLVNEAGSNRTYYGQGDGSYRYRSDITGSTYELRFRDRGSVTALKLGSGGSPTLLVRNGGPAPEETAAPVAAAAPAQPPTPPGAPPASPYLAVAERYQALALSDKKDVQSWAFCSAAALKRSMATKEVADAYGREAAERLASISVDPSRNPCPDAIPAELWPSESAEIAALKEVNAAQVESAARQRDAIAAMQAKAAADQKAYEQARAEYRAALEKSRQEQEAYARQQAAYKAALAEQQMSAARRAAPGKVRN